MCFLVLDCHNQKLLFYIPLVVRSKQESLISNLQFSGLYYLDSQTYFIELNFFFLIQILFRGYICTCHFLLVGFSIYTNSTLTSLQDIFEKRNIFNTRRCVVFRFTFSFLFPSTSQCPLYFLFDTNFYLTKYLYRRLEVKIYANVECVNKLFKAGDEFCLHSFQQEYKKQPILQ